MLLAATDALLWLVLPCIPLSVVAVGVLAAVLLRKRKACLATRTVEVPLAPAAALERARLALLGLGGGAHVPRLDEEPGRLEANVGLTWWSWGERVVVSVTPADDGESEVTLESWCRLGTTLIDYGKNRVNVELIATALLRSAQAMPQAQGDAIGVATRPASLARCPYCRDDVAASEAVACVACLARHHAGCWDEHGACSACGGAERFAGVERREGDPRPTRRATLKEGTPETR